ncbi:MAG: alkane 1-monooxygenase [Sediminibacterium sp.]|jgi:alkane 1-monooxygenase|nr:alkane 1-monooxygenase [Sediminibacterium sp.]
MIKSLKSFKYFTPFVLYILALLSFNGNGLICWTPLLYTFFLIPFVELFIKADPKNLDEVEEALAKKNKAYDLILYAAVIMQYYSLWVFFNSLKQEQLSTIDIIGRVLSMGLLCAAFGINVAHELGHRVNKMEQTFAKMLLLTSLYMHFFIEHNKGHHKHVATPHDPSTAKYNQSVYAFWPQTLIGTYLSAWKIANDEVGKKGKRWYSLQNEMLLFQIIQLLFVFAIYYFFGAISALLFIVAAFMGGLLLETVNYIEHYGLSRNTTSEEQYERVQPHHSWNSNHIIGRLMLFELSRHSDHHYLASRKYQILRSFDNAPQMPTGYPGMILLSLFPPLWFKIMHQQMKKYKL